MMGAFKTSLQQCFAGISRSRRRSLAFAAAIIVPLVLAVVIVAALTPALDASARIPVALVNLDEGATDADGRSVAAGDDLVDTLTDSDELAWDVVDEETATTGLARGDYALILEIPADYSEKVASLSGDSPERAQLQIISDGTENVLATQAGSAVLRQVQTRLRADLGEDYILQVLNDVSGQASSLSLTADGTVLLDSAYDALEEGTESIATGLEETASGTEELVSGIDTIATGVTATGTGASAIAQSIDAISNEFVPALSSGTSGISTGIDALASAADQLGDGIDQVASALDTVSDSMKDSISSLSGLVSSAPELGTHVESLAAALSTMDDASGDIETAVSDAVDAADDASTAIEELPGDAKALAQALSSDGSQSGTQGIVQRLAALDDQSAQLTAELTALASSEEVSADDLSDIATQLNQIDSERTALRQELEQTASDASALSDKAASASDSLESLTAVRGALAEAQETYGQAADTAQQEAAATSALANQIAEPVATAAGSLMVSQQTIEQGLVPALEASAQGATALGTGLESVGQGASALATGTEALPQVLSAISSATEQLGQGSTTLGDALSLVGTGVSSLGDGLSTLATVQSELADGVSQLHDGQDTINETLTSSSDSLSALSSDASDRADVAARSVSLTTSTLNQVDNSASTFAPLALSTVLWVGVLAVSCVLPWLDRRAVLAGRGGAAVTAGFASLGIGALILGVVVGVGVPLLTGARPANVAAYAALVALGSLAFAALVQALHALIGRRATIAVSIALLLLQLVCAGSVLPASFVADAFSALGSILPVPVLTGALRGAISGSLAGFGSACAVLICYIVAALVVSALAMQHIRRIRPERAFAS